MKVNVLQTGEIHAWWTVLDQPSSLVKSLANTLSLEERERADRYRFDKDKKHFIVRRGILRTILGDYLCISPERLRFYYGDMGKLTLLHNSNKSKIHFNLSHSGTLALYGFTRGQEIGVDIEKIRNLADMEQMAERFFSEREKADFCALPEDMKKTAFFNCWTRKEAYLKTIGTGLFHPLDKFEVSMVPGDPARLLRIGGDSKVASRWAIYELKPVSGYVAAIALQNQGLKIKCWQWRA